MKDKFLPASLLTAALFAGVAAAPVLAGHGMSQSAHEQMSRFMAHHPFIKHQERQDNPAVLGVAIAEMPQAELDILSLEYGVRIEKVLEGSVAEAAGIQSGDLVTAINGRPAYSPARLQHLVSEARGESTVTVARSGESLTLGAMFPAPQAGNAMLGVRIQGMTDELKEVFGTEGKTGVLISQVVTGSAAKQAGLKAGDVIVSLGGDDIMSVRDVHALLDGYAPGDKVDVAYVRDREKRSIQVELSGADAQQHHSYAVHPHGMFGHGGWGHGAGHGHGHFGHHGMMPGKGCATGKKQVRS
jgi:S1-C subfamily serine protease